MKIQVGVFWVIMLYTAPQHISEALATSIFWFTTQKTSTWTGKVDWSW